MKEEKEEHEKEEFEIKAYLKADLAQMYNPYMSLDAAMHKMRHWIHRNKKLYAAFYLGGEGINDQSYSRRQVRLLVQYLEAP